MPTTPPPQSLTLRREVGFRVGLRVGFRVGTRRVGFRVGFFEVQYVGPGPQYPNLEQQYAELEQTPLPTTPPPQPRALGLVTLRVGRRVGVVGLPQKFGPGPQYPNFEQQYVGSLQTLSPTTPPPQVAELTTAMNEATITSKSIRFDVFRVERHMRPADMVQVVS